MVAPDSAAGNLWAWHPELPIGTAPVFAWSLKPVVAVKYLLGRGLLLSPIVAYSLLRACIWLRPMSAPERWATFEAGGMAQVYAATMLLVVLVTGGPHLFFYTFRCQSDRRRFDLWFRSFHDGTPEATARVREFQREQRHERRRTAARGACAESRSQACWRGTHAD